MRTAKPTLVTAAMHLAGFSCGAWLWFKCPWWLLLRQTRWDLPAGATLVLYLADHPGIPFVLFSVALVIDIWVLIRLSRSATRGIQDVWLSLVAVGAMLAVSTTAVAVLAPYQAFYAARFAYQDTWRPVELREEQQLDGTWELIAREEAGVQVPADQSSPSRLEFDLEEHLANWTLGKQFLGEEEITPYLWHVDIAPPKRLSFFAFHLYTPEAGSYRELLYRFDDNQLVLVIAPPETPAQQLPVTFSTLDNENIMLFYRRVGFNGSVSE